MSKIPALRNYSYSFLEDGIPKVDISHYGGGHTVSLNFDGGEIKFHVNTGAKGLYELRDLEEAIHQRLEDLRAILEQEVMSTDQLRQEDRAIRNQESPGDL